jgi:EAL domain-containing protein (putative c-di-GMP-specific phosphodiesterase class I)
MTRDRLSSSYFGHRGSRSQASTHKAADKVPSHARARDLHAELREHISTRFGSGSSDTVAGPWPDTPSKVVTNFDIRMIETRYQPIVSMHDRRLVGVEVLARLNHPAWGFLQPDMFIPEIENAGLSPQLTDVVTTRALADLEQDFIDREHVSLAINLPLDVLLFPAAFDRMEMQRERAGVEASRLTIELTESRPVIDLLGLTRAIELWRRAGYRLAIDDVAPQIANYLMLFKLPFSSVKLDKGTVLAAVAHKAARTFLEETVAAAHAEGLTVTAEGIEDEKTWSSMDEIGADEAQGYFIARPLPSAMVRTWLEDWRQRHIGHIA